MTLKKNLIQNEKDRFVELSGGNTAVRTMNFGTLVPDVYDYISLSYTGTNLTGVVYKTGGSGGTTVATLVLGYTGSDLTSVTKT